MKIKDIWNPKFKLLNAIPQALWLMYPTMEDRKTHEFNYSLETLTDLTGHTKKSIIKANKDLEDHEIISKVTAHRKTTTYTLKEKPRLTNLDIKNGDTSFILSVTSTPNDKSLGVNITPKDTLLGCNIYTPSIGLDLLSNKTTTTTNNNVHNSNKEVVVFENSVRKEEEIVDMKFDWIDDLSLESLIKKHGEKYVLDRAIPINRANGKIKDKKSCLEDSLKLGYIYTCKELKEQEQKEKHKKYVDEQIEKNRQEQEERERLFSEQDPEAGNKAIAEFLSKIDEADKKINLKTFFP